jgi:hypothetical protein
MDRHSKYALLATALLCGGVALELARLILNAPWPGFSAWISHLVSGAFGTLWALTAVSLWYRHDSIAAARMAWVGSFFAPFVMFLHGLVTYSGGSRLGLGYVLVAALLGLTLTRVWDRGERLSTPAGASDHTAHGTPGSPDAMGYGV